MILMIYIIMLPIYLVTVKIDFGLVISQEFG